MKKIKEGCGILYGKRILTVLLTVIMCLSLCGCKEKIFEEETEVMITRYSKTDLENGKYYIKDGTGFYEPYSAAKTFSSSYTTSSESRLIWADQSEERLIPTLYKGESIVYVSSSKAPGEVLLERFNDCGYSVGIMGFTAQENGKLIQYTSSVYNLKEGSDAYEKLSVIDATNFTVADIDDKEITESDFMSCGILANMEYGKEYSLGIYIGSYYNAKKIEADTRIFVSDSAVTLSDISLTRNNYYAIQIPEDMESGYYYIYDYGIFRYVDTDKRTFLSDDEENKKNDSDDSESKKEQTIIKKVSLDDDCDVFDIMVTPLEESGTISSVEVTTPEEDTFTMSQNENSFVCSIENAVKGTYTFEIKTSLSEDAIEIESKTQYKQEEPVEDAKQEVTEQTAQDSESQQSSASPRPSSTSGSGSSNGGSSSGSSSTTYQWIPIAPEPLNEAEISGTQSN